MDKVALLPTEDRAALFGESGAARGMANTIVEKDFWVCWTLKRLFTVQGKDTASLVFKGGTSLSKAFNAIRRFSEDIDLSFDRADLGYTGDRDPEKDGLSKKKTSQLIDDLVSDVERHIADKLLPALHAAIVEHLGEPAAGAWSLEIDPNDAQTVNFHYRHGEKIKVSEFKNVIGRAGRAYVDVEGLVLYPIFEDAKNKKHDEWVGLIEDLGAREMESGLIQLILSLLSRMHARLGGNLDQLMDYVVNNAAAWTFPEVAGEKADKRERALKEWERHMALSTPRF